MFKLANVFFVFLTGLIFSKSASYLKLDTSFKSVDLCDIDSTASENCTGTDGNLSKPKNHFI